LQAGELGVAEPALANTDANVGTLELSRIETLFRREVSYNGQTFALGREMEVEVLRGDGIWVFGADECGLMGVGDTCDDAESIVRGVGLPCGAGRKTKPLAKIFSL
jgi:hypothetical protein